MQDRWALKLRTLLNLFLLLKCKCFLCDFVLSCHTAKNKTTFHFAWHNKILWPVYVSFDETLCIASSKWSHKLGVYCDKNTNWLWLCRSAGVTGELLVNGQQRNEHLFQRSSCYITQEDLLQPLLTVREAMDVAARLKLPKGAKVHSEEILQELGLLEHQHTKTDCLSGGQKKR